MLHLALVLPEFLNLVPITLSIPHSTLLACDLLQPVSSNDESRMMSDSAGELEDLEVNWSEKELTPELLHAWRSRMRRWCARELGGAYASRMDTSDVVQESMLQVWQDWSRFRGNSVGEVKSWLFRIARGHLHKARRHHRAAKRNVFTEAGELLEGGPADHGDPSEAAARSEDRLNLIIAIRQLEPELREVVQHRIFGQQSFVEIGERLGLSKGEARNRFLKALRRLKHSLDGDLHLPHQPR